VNKGKKKVMQGAPFSARYHPPEYPPIEGELLFSERTSIVRYHLFGQASPMHRMDPLRVELLEAVHNP
jgi:hypothetical protein